MKGDSWIIAIIVLALLGFIAFIFMSANGGTGFNFFSGGGQVFSNDVLTVYDHIISDRAPYDGERTTIEFSIKNAGKGTLKDVEVVLDPPTGFTSQVKCGSFGACKFSLDQGDGIDVLITLTAVKGVTQIIPADVRYSVRYPYQGEREVQIPIVANRKEVPKGQTFLMSDNSYGPIQVSFSTPEARETGQGSSVFAVSGIPVKLEMDVSDVGGAQGGTVRPVMMKGDQFRLVTTNMKIVGCDRLNTDGTLKVGGSSSTTSTTTTTSTTQSTSSGSGTAKVTVQPGVTGAATAGTNTTSSASTTSTKVGETVPFDIECVFEPATVADGDVQVGVVKATYRYEYRLDFLDQFAILPKNVPKIEGSTIGVTNGSAVKKGTAADSAGAVTSVGLISGTVSLPGTLASQSDKKYHKFDREPGAKYTIVLKGCVSGGFRPHMVVTPSTSDSYPADQTGTVGLGEKCETIEHTAPDNASKDYYVVVSSKSGQGDYVVEITKGGASAAASGGGTA